MALKAPMNGLLAISFVRRVKQCSLVVLIICCATVGLGQSLDGNKADYDSRPLTSEQGDEILNELRLIRQALERLQLNSDKPTMRERSFTAVQTKIGPDEYALGEEDAPVTMVEFADYQCVYCRRFQEFTFPELKKNYIDTGRLRFISRDYPLEFHADSTSAALGARCAGAQGKYWEMRQLLTRTGSELNAGALEKDVQQLGINLPVYRACVGSGIYSGALNADLAEARRIGVQGTPAFVIGPSAPEFIDGVLISGAVDYSVFASTINGAMTKETELLVGKALRSKIAKNQNKTK